MDQPADIRNLSARRSAGASVVELHTADRLRPELRDVIEPIRRSFGRPQVVTREHTNNAVRWTPGERLNHLLEEACTRFAASEAVVTGDVVLTLSAISTAAPIRSRVTWSSRAFSPATASASCSTSAPKPMWRCWRC